MSTEVEDPEAVTEEQAAEAVEQLPARTDNSLSGVVERSRAAILPASSDPAAWTDAEKVRVEAAGLVFTFPDWHDRSGDKVLAPRPVIERFLHTAARTGLDPLARQLYCIPRLSKGQVEWAVQTGIDGFRVVAERSRHYAGRRPFLWLTKDGQWVDVFVKVLHGDHPLAARAEVLRNDWDEPLVAVATWDEYVQTTSAGKVTAMWTQRGPGQLAKCAEALALRSAFPHDLSGVYTDDEIGAQSVDLDVSDDSPAGDPRPRGVSRAALLAPKPAETVQPVVVPEQPQDAAAGRTAPAVADPADDGEAEPVEACQNCRRATPVTELLESPGRDLCADCVGTVQP